MADEKSRIEVEISRDDLLKKEAEAFLETAKASPNPDRKYHEYRDAAVRTFLQKDPTHAVLDSTLIDEMWGGDKCDTEKFMDEFYAEEILFETRTKRVGEFVEKRKILITKDNYPKMGR